MQTLAAHAIRAHDTPMSWRPDQYLLGAVLALMGLGLIMVYSVTVVRADSVGLTHLFRQTIHILVGLGLMFIFARSSLDMWQRVSKPVLALGLLLLVLVLIPGIGLEVNGSQRWLAFGPVRVQPSELIKLLMVMYVAGYLTRKQGELRQFTKGILIIGIVLAVVGMLLLPEPDFGSFVVVVLCVFGMLFLAGVRLWHFALCLLVGGASLAALIQMSPYRTERVLSFLDPWKDPYDTGFQLIQSLIAFGRGEWLGVGLGQSVQKLFYLPHAETDFLLAVIGEELGLVGVLSVLLAFAVILWRGFAIARRAELTNQLYAARIAQGVTLLIVFQAMINIGVNMGALPTKGLTLPFMSYGGTSMVVSSMAIGLLLAVDRQTLSLPGSRR